MSGSAGGLAATTRHGLLALLLVVLGACAPAGGTTQPGATVRVEAAPTPTAPPPPLVAAQRDIDALDHQFGEMARLLVANGVPDAEFQARLEATFVGIQRPSAVGFFGRAAAAGFPDWRRPPADPVTRVLSVARQTATCRKLRATKSLRGFVPGANTDHDLGWIWLVPRAADARNPTGWAVAADSPDDHVPAGTEYC